MKILMIYPDYKEKPVTGGQMYNHHFVDRLISNGQHVDIITDEVSCKQKYFYGFAYLKKFFAAKKYDVVLADSRMFPRLLLLFLFLKIFSKTKLILIHHHFNFWEQRSFVKKTMHKFLELLFLKTAYGVVIPSPFIKQEITKLLPKKKIFYVELAVRKSTRYSNEQAKTNNINLLYVGTIEQRKGLKYLISALDLLNKKNIKFHCDIVGKIVENDYYLELKRSIEAFDLQDKINFCGRLSPEDLTKYYNNAVCFVFPSLLEGYGMVILEAMSYGLPVAAFNNSAMPFTIKNGINGLLAENKNYEEFAKNISTIMTDISLRNTLSQGALNSCLYFRTLDDVDKDIDLLCQSNFN